PDEPHRTYPQPIVRGEERSVASPTAGLTSTDAPTESLPERGITLHEVTLHVGAGTFLPVKSDDPAGHRMHAEQGSVTAETADALNRARRAGGRIVAVGSTSLRLLENAGGDGCVIRPFAGRTALFLPPGHSFPAA